MARAFPHQLLGLPGPHGLVVSGATISHVGMSVFPNVAMTSLTGLGTLRFLDFAICKIRQNVYIYIYIYIFFERAFM